MQRGTRRYAVLATFNGRTAIIGAFVSEDTAREYHDRLINHATRRGPYPNLRVWIRPLSATGTSLHAVLDYLTE